MNTTEMSPKIAAAIVKVAKNIQPIAKASENSHGKYMFTSVDDFYAAVGPLMADAGLFTLANQTESEVTQSTGTDGYGKTKTALHLRVAYDIFLVHESGEAYGPINRDVTVIASGPQAYAAAESFVTKYFVRNLFKIPTGDYDIDSDPKTELPVAPAKTSAKASAKAPAKNNPDEQPSPANEQANEPDEDNQPVVKKSPTKIEVALAFVAEVNAFLDANPSPAELFSYSGTVAAKMNRIRSKEYSDMPAVTEVLRRMNAVYATAPDAEREVGEDG